MFGHRDPEHMRIIGSDLAQLLPLTCTVVFLDRILSFAHQASSRSKQALFRLDVTHLSQVLLSSTSNLYQIYRSPLEAIPSPFGPDC